MCTSVHGTCRDRLSLYTWTHFKALNLERRGKPADTKERTAEYNNESEKIVLVQNMLLN